jgi:hypothetical protein
MRIHGYREAMLSQQLVNPMLNLRDAVFTEKTVGAEKLVFGELEERGFQAHESLNRHSGGQRCPCPGKVTEDLGRDLLTGPNGLE